MPISLTPKMTIDSVYDKIKLKNTNYLKMRIEAGECLTFWLDYEIHGQLILLLN